MVSFLFVRPSFFKLWFPIRKGWQNFYLEWNILIRRDLPHCEEGIISAKFTLSTQQSTTYVMMMIKKSWNEHENANQIDKGKNQQKKNQICMCIGKAITIGFGEGIFGGIFSLDYLSSDFWIRSDLHHTLEFFRSTYLCDKANVICELRLSSLIRKMQIVMRKIQHKKESCCKIRSS